MTLRYLSAKESTFLLVVTMFLFTILSIGVELHFFSHLDSRILLICNSYNHTDLYNFFLIFTKFSGESFALAAFFIILLILAKRKKYHQIFFSLTIFFISCSFGLVLKYAFSIPRPPNHIYGLSGYSFPSGHTILATTLVFIFYFTLYKGFLNSLLKKVILFLISTYLLLSLFSRILLGAHWTTDTIAGFLVACFSLAVTCLIMETTIYQKTFNFMLKFSAQRAVTKENN
jgi:undecaprenyl-diphosphatase